EIIREGPPRGGREAGAWLADHPWGSPRPRVNPDGPFVLHVGAGGRAKRWPLERWIDLATRLFTRGPVVLLAGHVEREQFSAEERSRFERRGGQILDTLAALADATRAARLFIGCDSGPTHLAAQLGVPTLALFGPIDPA